MENKFWKSLQLDFYFLAASFSCLFLGTVFAREAGKPFLWLNALMGVVIFLSLYLLQRVAVLLTSNQVNYYSKTSYLNEKQKSQLYIWIPFLFLLLGAALYTLLKAKVLIGVNLEIILLLALLMFLPIGAVGRLWIMPLQDVFKAFVAAVLMFFFGSTLQAHMFNGLMSLLALSLFLSYFGAGIANQFADYEAHLAGHFRSFVIIVGWKKAQNLHLFLNLFTFISLVFFLIASGSMTSEWPVLLSGLLSIASVYFLNSLAQGMKPNWMVIKASGILLFFSIIYWISLSRLVH